mmetsp:Transcript_17280/g.19942  ORF Transcript_17280/g.19942 Transcript_17280/m.19942 type:complete len:301 (+) Transcript_17280:26-928(+)
MTTDNNNNKFIPGLVSEAYFPGSWHEANTIPKLTKSIVDAQNGVDFEWQTVGSSGELYVIQAVGKLEWQTDLRNQLVARGLEVECTCPNGKQQAVHSKSIRKIVVCKHGEAALTTVLDPKAVCPEHVSQDLYPSEDITIDGAPVEEHIWKTTRGKACDSCGFRNWSIGDRKYIVEHWINKDSDYGAREHLCPACAVKRGLPYEYFYQNKHATAMIIEELVPKSIDDDDGVCHGCGNNSKDRFGSYTVKGLLEVKNYNAVELSDGKKSNPVHLLCLACAYNRVHLSLKPRGEKRKQCFLEN